MQFPNKGKIDIDIVIEKDKLFYPIELKYKIKQEEVKFNRFGEDTSYLLKEHSRIPMNKYDFWKDVARLEFLKESFNNVVGGLCVFLTNNKNYKEEGSSKDFSMKGKNPVSNTRPLRFETPGLAKKCPEFSLLEEYQIDEWHNIKNKKTNIDFHYCMVRVEKGTIAIQLHKLFNKLERFDYNSFSDPEKKMPKKGVYVFFEKGEEILISNGGKLDRIVRVGTHYNQKEIQKRLKSHFTTTNSVFREDVKKALIKRSGANVIADNFINDYMRKNFSFSILEFEEEDVEVAKENRLKWEYKLIQTISKAVFLGEITSSEKWLGKFSPINEITKGGLWQKEGVYDEVTSQDFEDLAKRIRG